MRGLVHRSFSALLRAVVLLLPVAAGLAGMGCGKPDPADRPVIPSQVLDFATLFSQNCSGCHGADGKLGPAPPLADPLLFAILPEAELRDIVQHGRKGTLMPPFLDTSGGGLTMEQVEVLVTGLPTAWGNAEWPKLSNVTLPTYRVAEAPAGSAERGSAVFTKHCASCHGPEGRGTEEAGPLHEAAFLDLVSDQFLRRITITGRPDLGMPNFLRADAKQPLTDENISDVVAYLASWRSPAPAPMHSHWESKSNDHRSHVSLPERSAEGGVRVERLEDGLPEQVDVCAMPLSPLPPGEVARRAGEGGCQSKADHRKAIPASSFTGSMTAHWQKPSPYPFPGGRGDQNESERRPEP